MKYIYLLILGVLSFSFISASSTESYFDIAGCSQYNLPRATCSADGTLYCDSSDNIWNTMTTSKCFGTDGIRGNSDDCCPRGYICTDNGCVQSLMDCEDFDGNQSGCEGISGCSYVDGKCLAVTDISCESYKSKSTCEKDILYLGKTRGVGTEICRESKYLGNNSIVVQDSCKCIWKNNRCILTYNVSQLFFLNNPDEFSCEKTFSQGECVSGSQEVSWTASTNPEDHPLAGAADCVAGSQTLACGQKLVKLPFFSLFNIISVAALLIVFYFLRKK
jgi:hypothetical protein